MKFIKITAILLTMTFFCGCVTHGKKTVKDYYMLSAERNATAAKPAAAKFNFTIIADKFAVAEGFGGTSLVYRNKKGLYESDYYRHFLTDKGVMLSTITTKWLSESGIFKHVIDSRAGISSSYRLKGLITEMYADMKDPKNAVAVLKVHTFIVDKGGNVMFSKSYDMTSPIAAETADAVVEATNLCTVQYLTALESDLLNATFP